MQEVIKILVCNVRLEYHKNVLILRYVTEHQVG